MKFFDSQLFIHQLSIDCVIFGYKDNQINVLIPKIGFGDKLWSLCGGFIKQDESIDAAAQRILEERTGLKDIFLEQFRVFGKPERSNLDILNLPNVEKNKIFERDLIAEKNLDWLAKRFVSIGYYALVDINKVNPQRGELDESIAWYSLNELPQMIMDHNEMVSYALETLRQNLDQRLIGFNLLPETFTMKEVQELYEAVYDKPFARNNFQKKILDLDVLERLEKKFTGAANKAPYLYRFKK
jgi:8-oxo-dGTP diphosphatase